MSATGAGCAEAVSSVPEPDWTLTARPGPCTISSSCQPKTERNTTEPCPAVAVLFPKGNRNVAVEVGSDFPRRLDHRRAARLHRDLGRERRHRAGVVLHLRRDLPGAADPGTDGLSSIAPP